MDYVRQLYENLRKTFQSVEGKIFVPISGGLDSRVVATLLGNNIDLSYTFGFRGEKNKHMDYANDIVNALKLKKNHYNIIINGGTNRRETFRKLEEEAGVDLKEYTMYIPHGMETLTGIHITPFLSDYMNKKVMRDYFFRVREVEEYWIEEHKHLFKDIITPFRPIDTRLIFSCLTMPLSCRINQRTYREMIVRYFPEVAHIPRETMDFRIDTSEFVYTCNRVKYTLKKLWR